MLAAGEVFENPRTGARLEVLRTPREGGELEVERVYEADSWGDGPPIALQRALMPLLAALGRVRGYKAS